MKIHSKHSHLYIYIYIYSKKYTEDAWISTRVYLNLDSNMFMFTGYAENAKKNLNKQE